MSSLKSILNPEDGRKKLKLILNLPEQDPGGPPSSRGTTPVSETSDSPLASFKQNYSHDKNHGPHPNCPSSLCCLPDTTGRPQHTLPIILRCAILGSPNQRLTIREIYAAMEAKYNYYTAAGQTWKQSVRHHLSLNRLFERQERPDTDPGFGSYWTVNLSAPPGTKRPRKRGRAKAKECDESPRKHGRPRTISFVNESDETEPPDTTLHPIQAILEGVEEDMPPAPSDSSPSVSAYKYPTYVWPPQCHRSGEDVRLEPVESFESPRGESDGHDTREEDQPVHPMNRRPELVGLDTYKASNIPLTSPPLNLPPISQLQNGVDESDWIDQRQAEMDALRKQSADAISLSLRLSEQLSHSQEETTNMRAALQEVEDLLKHESRRRRKAEDALSMFLSAGER